MKQLPLYPEVPRLALETEGPLARNTSCSRCPLNRSHLKNPCITADGYGFTSEGGLLVLTDFPYGEEDMVGRVNVSSAGGFLRRKIEEQWKGSVVYDVALRCAPGSAEIKPGYVNSCRGYLRPVYDEVRPSRILCFGPHAARAVLGRGVHPLSCRKGYAYTSDGTLVFILQTPLSAIQNRFLSRIFDEDLEWALTAVPTPPPWDASYYMVETPEDARAAVAELRKARWWTYDTETSGVMWDGPDGWFEVETLAAGPSLQDTAYVWDREALQDPDRFGPLAEALQDPTTLKAGQNLKYDAEVMPARRGLRCRVRGVALDTMLAARALESDVLGRLEYLVERVGMGGMKEENDAALKPVLKEIKYLRGLVENGMQVLRGVYPRWMEEALRHPNVDAKAFAYAGVPADTRNRYCARDVVGTIRVGDQLAERIAADSSMTLLNERYITRATETFAQIEEWGMAADRPAIEEVRRHLQHELAVVEKKLKAHGDFDPSNDNSLREYLFGTLGLTPIRFTDKDHLPSTDAATLKALKHHHPSLSLILEWKELEKMRNTYAEGLLKHVRGDGRIHPSFNIAGARTGRLSAKEPNLQNQPSRGRLAKLIKNCFIAPPGYAMLQLDFSQLELRVAAVLAKDETLAQIFREGRDIHRRTAELVAPLLHGVSTEEAEKMTDAQIKPWRQEVKPVNFGFLYGKGPATLAKEIGCEVQVAEKLKHAILGRFDKVDAWIREQEAHALQYGFTYTYHLTPEGPVPLRRRQLFEIGGPDDYEAGSARRSSYNCPIQGTASDLMVLSLIEVVDWIVRNGIPARVTNTVHDSVILEVRVDWLDRVALKVKSIMEGRPSGNVPLVADCDVGRTWGSMTGVWPTDDGWGYKVQLDDDTEEVRFVKSLHDLVA